MSLVPGSTPLNLMVEAEPRSIKHKTLSSYYPHLYTLRDYILLSTKSSLPRALLFLPSDPPEYGCLIRETICAVSAPPKGTARAPGIVMGSQQEAIDRALAEIARKDTGVGQRRNILLTSTRVGGIHLLTAKCNQYS
jgi:hypothetical protein